MRNVVPVDNSGTEDEKTGRNVETVQRSAEEVGVVLGCHFEVSEIRSSTKNKRMCGRG